MIIKKEGLIGIEKHIVNYMFKYMPECIEETVDNNNVKIYNIDEVKLGENIRKLRMEREHETVKPIVRIDDPLDDFNELVEIPKLVIPTMYHGTDARIVRMSSEEITKLKERCTEALHYMWSLYKPFSTSYYEPLKKYLDCEKDPDFYFKLVDKLNCCSAMHRGKEEYQYEYLYLTNSKDRAKGYARRAYAFGEIGEVTYIMYLAAKKIKFKDWNPTDEILNTLEFIKDFAEGQSEPVVLKFDNLDPLYFETDHGKPISRSYLEFSEGSMFSFRYIKPIKLDLSNAVE